MAPHDTYGKASLVAVALTFLLDHYQYIQLIATLVAIAAGLISIWKGLRGK